ncbi:HNH endonuclease family protein [Streptomyces sp. 769]|uniref:HNH endonuclease family protein n=1 Tax=Streptomyces sp. 769 TaxID=1262452 RepID=UPI00057E2E86|nr:HNH endonuclease family protein [Streptomyces sp. 769]AJC60353.1 secreted protein [Streptomyces sp. 769]
MLTNAWWRRVATTTALIAAVVLPSASTTATAAPDPRTTLAPASRPAGTGFDAVPLKLPDPPPVGEVRTELAGLHVAKPHSMEGYSRAKFPHWINQYGKCDTREVVLARDGEDVKQDEECRAISGTWFSEYDAEVFHNARQLDIDHVVPLANAWRSGADTWTTPERRKFANDLVHSQLIAVSARSNRSKGDQSPDQWAPPRHAYWCTYARAWTDVKHVYHLNVTEPEKAKLTEMLDTCAP